MSTNLLQAGLQHVTDKGLLPALPPTNLRPNLVRGGQRCALGLRSSSSVWWSLWKGESTTI